MDLAYQGEITTPSQCGRMDQCCAFGARPILMTFDGDKARASLWCKCTARFPSHKLILLQECHIRWHSSHSCDTEKLEEDPHETAHACGCARVQLDCEELSLRSPLYIVKVELAVLAHTLACGDAAAWSGPSCMYASDPENCASSRYRRGPKTRWRSYRS
mmetsp:Transcript_18531/g.39914  ORF Transcript_18531/g.39914 Transcript_18531/m.39914 type:complete len:160 (-) Transcript_18531:243-722(-)